MDRPPPEMSLLELQTRCQCEMEKFSRHEASSEEFCLEIFRRALLLHDDQAWEILTRRFSATILGWLRRHPNYADVCRAFNEEDYVALVIQRLWMVSVHNQTLEFRSLAGALKFLRVSLNSIVIDTLRSQSKELPIPEVGFTEPAAPATEEIDEVWESIQSMLPDARERRLAYLLYYCNLKPRQIIQFCPHEFEHVQQIFQMKRSILDRIKRNKNRLRWLLDEPDL